MKNSRKYEGVLVQLQYACAEVGHACELASLGAFKAADAEMLLMALLEMAGNAEKLRDAVKKDEADHDGDTQPTGLEPPAVDPDAQCPDHGCARWRCAEQHEPPPDVQCVCSHAQHVGPCTAPLCECAGFRPREL